MHDPYSIDDAAGDSPQLPPPADTNVARPRKRGFARLSWSVILIILGALIVRANLNEGPGEAAQQERLQEIEFDIQARCLIGTAYFEPASRLKVYDQARPLDHGSWEQRLRFVVLAGELAGPEEAVSKARTLRDKLMREGNDRQKELAKLLLALYRDYAGGDYHASSLSEDNRAFLQAQLPWFGELALHPPLEVVNRPGLPAVGGAALLVLEDAQFERAGREKVLEPALTAFGAIIGAVGGICFLSFAGFVGLLIFLILLARRQVTGGLACGSDHGGIYAETFALYLLVFGGLSFLVHVLPLEIPILVKASLAAPLSLVVVGWPVLRGVPWSQVRQDIGWTPGRSPALEPAMGLACYLLSLPIVLLGVVLTFILMAFRNQLAPGLEAALAQHQPIHPIVEFIVNGSAADRVLVFIDACILAPIVEETMFRGVLYRHLRELSYTWPWLGSVIFSGTVVSFMFAAIHPQGLVAVPVLMALAYGFTIAREWRGSLIPCMVGHALNNGLVLSVVMLLMGK